MAGLNLAFQRIARGEARLGFDPLANDAPRLATLPVEAILLDPNQPRQELGDLTELADSIREHGVLQPLIVEPLDERRYQLIAGERRLTAAKEAGLAQVPAMVRTIAEHRRLEVQLVENLHRKELSPLEEAGAYRRLMEEFSLSQRDLAARIGKSVAAINQTLRLLDLPERWLADAPGVGELSRSLLLEIAKAPAAEQAGLWAQAKRGRLTVRKARERQGRSAAAKPAPVRIVVEGAVVTVALRGGAVSHEAVAAALTAAVGEWRNRLRSPLTAK